MIQDFVNKLMANEQQLRASFAEKAPGSYKSLVEQVVKVIGSDDDDWNLPDPKRVHEINDGDYQGTLLFVIGAGGYQPSTYWAVSVGYGSCSGCDTLEAIRECHTEDDYEKLTDDAVRQLWQLAVNIVQGLKLITGAP